MKALPYVALCAAFAAMTACAPAGGGGSASQLPSSAPTPTDITSFEGARAGQAENGIRNLGYEIARQEGLTTYWLNSSTQDCARIVTGDGRYQSVTRVSSTECGAGGNATQLPASTPTAAEQACLRDVSATTNNGDVQVLSSSFSQAGTEVIVGVGPQRARWSCIAYSDGSTAGIQSLTNEGTL